MKISSTLALRFSIRKYSVISCSTTSSHGCEVHNVNARMVVLEGFTWLCIFCILYSVFCIPYGGVGGIYMVVHIHTDGSLATGPDPPTDVFINIPLCPAIVIKMIIVVIILIIIAIIVIIRPPMAPLIFIAINPQKSPLQCFP